MNRIHVDVDPTAARYMQQDVRRNWDEACKCRIADMAGECYSGKIMYVFETPEESGTDWEYGTAIVHAKCGRPVYLNNEQWRAADRFLSQWEFFSK